MAIFTWPLDFRPQSQVWRMNYNNFAFTSVLSNSQDVYGYPGSYWSCDMTFDTMKQDVERRLTVMLGRLQGMQGTCLIPDFVRNRKAQDLGKVTVTDGKAQSVNLVVTGLPKSKACFQAGDYVSVNGEMFEILEDIASGNDGTANLPLNRRLRANIASGQPVEYFRPASEMRLTTDQYSINRQPIISSTTITFREAF
ncbi:hypothetical protein LMG33818_000876 [Halomonadaceae bacterium LMG 33818]